MFDHAKAKQLIEGVLSVSDIGVKSVWVGRSGSLLLTFFSLEAARDALVRMSDFANSMKIADGYDGSGRDRSKVYRLVGMMGA
jgi:hypothetical protein